MGAGLALDAAWLFAAVLVAAVLAAALIAARRFLLERGGGTVECGLRRGGGSWRLGLASYQREELCWYGVFGLSMRPAEAFPRRDMSVVSRREPTEAETASLGPGMVVVKCELSPPPAGPRGPGAATRPGGTVELALGEAALTGLLSWLEAAPPGSHLGVAL